MISFEYLNKAELTVYAEMIFDILSGNMTKISPTGNALKEDFKMWLGCINEALQTDERQIILINDKTSVIGYFQYSVNEDVFFMEEFQLRPEYQGIGIFRALYGFVLADIKADLRCVKAYASISNKKSIGILEKLGLKNVGLNKNGRSYRFEGEFTDLIKWYEKG